MRIVFSSPYTHCEKTCPDSSGKMYVRVTFWMVCLLTFSVLWNQVLLITAAELRQDISSTPSAVLEMIKEGACSHGRWPVCFWPEQWEAVAAGEQTAFGAQLDSRRYGKGFWGVAVACLSWRPLKIRWAPFCLSWVGWSTVWWINRR